MSSIQGHRWVGLIVGLVILPALSRGSAYPDLRREKLATGPDLNDLLLGKDSPDKEYKKTMEGLC
jgi:hypothetical protein